MRRVSDARKAAYRAALTQTRDEFRQAFTTAFIVFLCLYAGGVDIPLIVVFLPLLIPLAIVGVLMLPIIAVLAGGAGDAVWFRLRYWPARRRRDRAERAAKRARLARVQPAPPICLGCQRQAHDRCVGRSHGYHCGCPLEGCGGPSDG